MLPPQLRELYELASSRRDGWACDQIDEGNLDHPDVRPYVRHLENQRRTRLPPVHRRSIVAWYGDSL